jgi:threonine/homoserine/homoserine lactone efflux protein
LTSPIAAISGGVRRGVLPPARRGAGNLFNPKIIVFFCLPPPFIRPENGSALLQLVIFGAIFNVGGTLINFAVAAFAGKIGERLSGDARIAAWFARASAGLFLILAARMAFERR